MSKSSTNSQKHVLALHKCIVVDSVMVFLGKQRVSVWIHVGLIVVLAR